MGEVLFYHLTDTPLERTLPELLERSLQRGWPVVVRAGSAERIEALDTHLWTYRDDSFLPHGTAEMDHVTAQPILLTNGSGNPNGAKVLMLVDGARLDAGELSEFDRICLLFNGHETEALEDAREDWRALKEAGGTGKYWAQENGSWVEKAST